MIVPTKTLHVDGLPRCKGISRQELGDIFSRHGSVQSVKIAENELGLCKGFGFVEMAHIADAECILHRPGGLYFRGTKLRLEYSTAAPSIKSDVCYSWMYEGKCNKGPDCRFKHEIVNTELCPTFSTTGACDKPGNCTMSHDKKRLNFCVDFMRGRCSFRRDCKFSHGDTDAPPVQASVTTASQDTVNRGSKLHLPDSVSGNNKNDAVAEGAICLQCDTAGGDLSAVSKDVTPDDAECDAPLSPTLSINFVVTPLTARHALFTEIDLDSLDPLTTLPEITTTAQDVDRIAPTPHPARPDLCPTLLSTGRCEQRDCKSSHDKDLLTFCAQWRFHGDCKYKSNCKFPHPAEYAAHNYKTAMTHSAVPQPGRLTSEAIAALNNEKEAARRAVETDRTRRREPETVTTVVSVDSEYSCSSTERYCRRRRIRHRSARYYKRRSGVVIGSDESGSE